MCGRQTTSDKERIDNEESVKVLEKATVKFMTMELKLRDEGLENMEKGISMLDGEGQVQEQGSERGESRKQLKKVGIRGKSVCSTLSSVIVSKLKCSYFHG